MIDLIMYQGIGCLAAGLFLLTLVPFVHGRAVRLTTRRLEDAQPSWPEVVAEKDLQRAGFALSVRRLELKLHELKDKHACGLAELGRKSDAFNQLRMEADGLRDLLQKSEQISVTKTDEAYERDDGCTRGRAPAIGGRANDTHQFSRTHGRIHARSSSANQGRERA